MSDAVGHFTIIGDLLRSRNARDRGEVHDRLGAALDQINTTCTPLSPFSSTVGDEYQARFERLGDALTATLRLQLLLAPEIGVRHGIGLGATTVLQREPLVEDGPGWWAARAAITDVEAAARRPATRSARTMFEVAADDPALAPWQLAQGAVNAALRARDELVSRLDERGLSVLSGLLAGDSQAIVAERLGISPSAVSQRVRSDGLGVLVAMDRSLGGMP